MDSRRNDGRFRSERRREALDEPESGIVRRPRPWNRREERDDADPARVPRGMIYGVLIGLVLWTGLIIVIAIAFF